MSYLFVTSVLSFLLIRSSCSSSKNETNHTNRTVYFGPDANVSQDPQLIVETSSRSTHQIISHIFVELVRGKLNYTNVQLRLKSNGKGIDDLLQSFNDNGGEYPSAMVNLEIQQPVGLNLKDRLRLHSVVDVGALGPLASPGIYVPQAAVHDFWTLKTMTLDYWRTLTSAAVFSALANRSTSPRHVPSKCSKSCANLLLLKSDESYMKPLIQYIKEKKLRINPYIMDNSTQLDELFSASNAGRMPHLLFSVYPDCFTLKYNLVKVATPCDSMNFSVEWCYELRPKPLHKWVWKNISVYNPHIIELIKKIHFSQTEYESLIRKVLITKMKNKGRQIDIFRQVAQDWIDDNPHIWNEWIPNIPKKYELVIAGLFTATGSRAIPNVISKATRMVRYFNDYILKSEPYYLKLDAYPVSSNDVDTMLFAFNKIMYNCNKSRHLIGIIAMVFTDMAIGIAEISNHYNIPIISPTAVSLKKNRGGEYYPNFFRVQPDHSNITEMIKYLFSQVKWKRLALFRQSDILLTEQSLSPLEIVHSFKCEARMLNSAVIRKELIAAKKKNARIFLLDYDEKGAARIQCMAAKLNMTPKYGYVWFLDHYVNGMFAMDSYRKLLNDNGCNDIEAKDITSVILSINPSSSDSFFKSQARMKYFYKVIDSETKLFASDEKYRMLYAMLQDTLLVFHAAFDSLINNKSISAPHYIDNDVKMKAFLYNIKHTTADGVTFFNNVRTTKVWTLYVTNRDGFSYQTFLWRRLSNGTNGTIIGKLEPVLVERLARHFPNSKLPTDGELCVWLFFSYDCSATHNKNIIIGITAGTVMFCIIVLMMFVFAFIRCYLRRMKHQYPQPFAELQDALSDYEVPRTALQLQYPLGEGAFGTVYYGEMKKSTDTWTGVAAKVLRDGATSQERREFLCEALKMRDFDHPNVMTIIGVVTTEPHYVNIMEFMLLGDLRKYLLTRHNLAKTEPDAQDIRPATLTGMALDIARGLEYLHQNMLVHRDLACRNCLVNKEYRVKIGDFGMTREIDDKKAYYRFEHPGILPVRWMAPESIQSGIFSFTTDVWSFGVVLYEIVTFGNQPYRGRTNEEVIDSMKRCSDSLSNYLVNPTAHIPQLFTLMRLCWYHRPTERPLISYLIGQLEVNPECVRPCLDEAPPDPGDPHPRAQGLDRCTSVFVGDQPPCSRGNRGVTASSGIGAGVSGVGFTRMISGGSRSSCDRTRFASGNRVDTDMRNSDSMSRVNNLTINSFTNSIASRLGLLKDSSNPKWYSGGGGGNGSKTYRHALSQEFLSYSRHHSGDQEISTVSDPHAYQVDYDPLAFVTVHSLAANAISNSGYSGVPTQRGSSSGGQREDDELDTDQQTLLNCRRV